MFHQILYCFHIIGMSIIIGLALFLFFYKNITEKLHKALALYLMSAAHTQVLSGFVLFFLLFASINHMKVGIKMLIAVEVAVITTIYRKKIANNEKPKPVFLLLVLVSTMATTVIAFVW